MGCEGIQKHAKATLKKITPGNLWKHPGKIMEFYQFGKVGTLIKDIMQVLQMNCMSLRSKMSTFILGRSLSSGNQWACSSLLWHVHKGAGTAVGVISSQETAVVLGRTYTAFFPWVSCGWTYSQRTTNICHSWTVQVGLYLWWFNNCCQQGLSHTLIGICRITSWIMMLRDIYKNDVT